MSENQTEAHRDDVGSRRPVQADRKVEIYRGKSNAHDTRDRDVALD